MDAQSSILETRLTCVHYHLTPRMKFMKSNVVFMKFSHEQSTEDDRGQISRLRSLSFGARQLVPSSSSSYSSLVSDKILIHENEHEDEYEKNQDTQSQNDVKS